MQHSLVEQHLSLVEAQLQVASAALVDADPSAIQSSSTKLQMLVVNFAKITETLGAGHADVRSLASRIQASVRGITLLREGLARRSAYVERALEVVVPGAQKSTGYADIHSPYGSTGRSSGQFKTFTA